MHIEIRSSNEKKKVYLTPDIILKYLLLDDDKLDTLVMCKKDDTDLITTDKEVYEALGSIRAYDTFRLNKLVKFLESVDIYSYKANNRQEKPVLKFERIEELRKLVLKK